MFGKDLLWSPSGKGVVLRVLSCANDGSITYSWKYNECSDCKPLTFVRHFDPINNDDKVMLVCQGTAEIVHASLSIDKSAIAFTIWFQPEKISSNEKLFEVVTNITKATISEIEDHRPLMSHDFSSSSSESLDQNINPNSEIRSLPSPPAHHRGVYRSYVAQTHPTGWFMKFTGHNLSQEDKQRRKFNSPDEKLMQKPVFTNYYDYRVVGDIKLSQYEIVLMTHKHSIGIYNLLLEHNSNSASRVNLKSSSENVSNLNDRRRCRVYGRPDAEVLAEKVVWSQWDELNQRLYYVLPTRTPKEQTNKTGKLFRLIGVQFYRDSPRQQVFDVELDFDISAHAARSASTTPKELDPTVSSRDLNMKLCVFPETGSLCLCWQEIPCIDSTPQWAYNIAILDKDIVIRHRFQKGDSMAAMSFIVLGENILVHSPGSYVHCYDVESISCEYDQISNGLYHLFLSESLFRQLTGVSLEPIMSQQYFDDLFEPILESTLCESTVSTDSTLTSCLRQQAVICFDKLSKSFYSISIDADEFKRLFSDKSLTVQNRIFLTRQAVWLVKGNDAPSPCLIEVYRYIRSDPTDQCVTAVISQLLIALTYIELLDPKYSVPALMMSLFPITLPASALKKMVPSSEQNFGELSCDYLETRLKLKAQIEQFVTSLVARQKRKQFNAMNSHEGHDLDHMKNHEHTSSSWFRSLHACETGCFTEYNLDSIRPDLTEPETQSEHPGEFTEMMRTKIQLQHSRKKLESPRSQSCDSSADMTSSNDSFIQSLNKCPRTWFKFLEESERNPRTENLYVVTYYNLCDHLFVHLKSKDKSSFDDSDLKELARNYVHAQVHITHHTLTSILMTERSDNLNFDRPLYTHASSAEQDLLFALNQFQLVCEITCFPLPNGFHTLIACLTFRSLLARHGYSDGYNNALDEDIARFSECFFDYIDRKLIQITDEFVSKMLKELGNKELFGSILEEMLKRMRSLNEDDPVKYNDLLQWRNVKAETHIARTLLKDIYGNQPSFYPALDSDERPRASSDANKEQSVSALLKENKAKSENTRHRSQSVVTNSTRSSKIGFPPLDALLDFVRKAENDVTITPSRNGMKEKLSDLIESSVLKQAA